VSAALRLRPTPIAFFGVAAATACSNLLIHDNLLALLLAGCLSLPRSLRLLPTPRSARPILPTISLLLNINYTLKTDSNRLIRRRSCIQQLYLRLLSLQLLSFDDERTKGVTEAGGRVALLVELCELLVSFDIRGGSTARGDHEDEEFLVGAFLHSAGFKFVWVRHDGGCC